MKFWSRAPFVVNLYSQYKKRHSQVIGLHFYSSDRLNCLNAWNFYWDIYCVCRSEKNCGQGQILIVYPNLDKSHILHIASKSMMIHSCIYVFAPSRILFRMILHLLICKNCIWEMQWGIIPFPILNRRSSTRRLVSHNENIEGQPEGSGRSQKSFGFSVGVALIPKNYTWLRHFQKKSIIHFPIIIPLLNDSRSRD